MQVALRSYAQHASARVLLTAAASFFFASHERVWSQLVTASRQLCVVLWCIVAAAGCRPTTPAQFTPSPQTVALTDGIDDPEELKEYRGLQSQIAKILRERCGEPASPKLLGDREADSERLQRGAQLFGQYCVQCHGVNGDGKGILAPYLRPSPRDYTRGVFKFVSTSNGKPRRADLIATIRRGVSGTSMPSFAQLSNDELADLADYVIALSQRGELEQTLARVAYDDGELPAAEDLDGMIAEILTPWQEADGSIVMPLTPMPPMTDESVAEGRELFLKFACSRCHGNDGRGGAIGSVDVGADIWGDKVPAADLTSGMLRGGGRPIDVYRRIYAGIIGTPMPAFATQFQENPDDIWKLVHFVKDTGQRRRRGLPPAANVPAATPPAESNADAQPSSDAPVAPEATAAPDGDAPPEDKAEAEAPPSS